VSYDAAAAAAAAIVAIDYLHLDSTLGRLPSNNLPWPARRFFATGSATEKVVVVVVVVVSIRIIVETLLMRAY
jgi:hypothetical protein